MRPPLPRLLSLLLLAASPLAAQTRVELVPGGTGVSGQTGANAATRPVPIGVPGSALVSPLSLAPSLAPAMAAPALSPQSAAAPALAAAPSPAAAATPPSGVPPGAAATPAPAGTPPGGPGFLRVLADLGVPAESLARVRTLATPSSSVTADIAAGMSERAHEEDGHRVLVILAAALSEASFFDSVGVANELGARFGFTGNELAYLVKRLKPGEASSPFSDSQRGWSETWVRRLRLAQDISRRAERGRFERALIGANEQADLLLADRLRDQPDYDLLPDEFKSPEKARALTGPAPRDPQAEADAKSANRYIAGIMGKRKPNARETEALLGDWLNEKGIPPRSARALAVRDLLLPSRGSELARLSEALDPAIRHRAPLIDQLAREKGVPPLRIQEVLRRRGLMELAKTLPDALFERQVDIGLTAVELQDAVSSYPDNAQGDLMREIAGQMSTKSGKSIEEVSRDGVFVYADFYGSTFREASAGRDPDAKGRGMVFYVTRRDGRWRFDGYRQNRPLGRTDAELIESLKSWLVSGGIPESDLK